MLYHTSIQVDGNRHILNNKGLRNWWHTSAFSPDLNPIELIWGSLKQYLCTHVKPKNIEQLKVPRILANSYPSCLPKVHQSSEESYSQSDWRRWWAGIFPRERKQVGKPHLNVYELVEEINREESITIMKVQQLLAGAYLAPRRRRLREKERRIQPLFQRLELGTISIDDYLEMVKHLTGLFFFLVELVR